MLLTNFIGYADINELLRTLPKEVRTVYLYPETSMERIPQTNTLMFQRRISIQIFEKENLVRYLLLVIGQVEREYKNGQIEEDELAEESLTRRYESAINAIEEWFARHDFEVERAHIAVPTFAVLIFGAMPDFLVYDEDSDSFSLYAPFNKSPSTVFH